MGRTFFSIQQKLFCLGFFVIGLFFSAGTAHAATSWSTTMIQLGGPASSTRVLWDSTNGQFAVGYTHSAGTLLNFSTSSAGSSWSTATEVLATTNLATSDTFFTTNGLGTGYMMFGMVSGGSKIYKYTTNLGATWDSATLTRFDHYINGQVQTDGLGNTYIVGRMEIGGTNEYVVFGKTAASPAADSFTTSSIAGPTAGNPVVDFTYNTSYGGAVAYAVMGSGVMGVATSTGMVTWADLSFTPSASYSLLLRPRIKFDSNGVMYIVSVGSNNFPCTVACDVILSRYSGGSWTTEVVDTVGSVSGNAQHDLAFVNGTQPIIVYYNNATGALRYAVKDSGNSGCSGAAAAEWTCGTVATGLTMPPATSITTNGRTNAVIVYQNNITGLYAAYATITAATSDSTTVYGLPKSIPPKNPKIVVNNGDLTSDKLDVEVRVSADNASEVALSTSPDFYGAIWEPLSPVMHVKLQKRSGMQTIYAKFTNPTGGVSNVVFGSVYYIAPVVIKPEPPAPMIPPPENKPEPDFSVMQPPKPSYELFAPTENFDPFNPGAQTQGMIISVSQPSCPERVNSFTLGGSIIQEKNGDRYLLLPSQKIACPVSSYAVARSWGITSFKRGSIDGYQISSLLPYRPGTIIRDAKTRAMYFVNTKGKLHPFPDYKTFVALGYARNPVFTETSAVIEKFVKTVTLTRLDMHPDGTMLVLDARKGEYGILQNRILYPISRKTLLKYKENIGRAVKVLSGELYVVGDRWE